MKRTGLAVMRQQPGHLGHGWIQNTMIQHCETAIVMLGSAQLSGDQWNPWTFDQRKQMIKNVYGDRIKILPIRDLGTDATSTEWCRYVIQKVTSSGLPEPTDYYTGSQADAIWYKHHFVADGEMDPHVVKNATLEDGSYRKLHIMHRDTNAYLPATDLRTFLMLGDDSWKQHVPRVNWEYIEETFPEHLKIKTEN